jgi:Zn finger protein HypA/HybF involved in hydrogenase expression
MLGQGIKARCRKCNNEALASEFRMHYDYKMMVCPNCFKGEREKPKVENKLQPKEEQKIVRPPGWDAEDDYLNRYSRNKQEQQKSIFKKIPGTDQVMCTCPSCKYVFKYDPYRKMPQACPYCDGSIPRVGTFNLL